MTKLSFLSFLALIVVSAQLYNLTRKTKHIMSDIEDLQAADAALLAKADELLAFAASQATSITSLKQQIADLQAQIGASGGDSLAIQSVIAAMKAETAKMEAALPPLPPPAL